MTVETFTGDGIAADIHRPETRPQGVAILAHGAGGNREVKVLQAYADELSTRAFLVTSNKRLDPATLDQLHTIRNCAPNTQALPHPHK